MAEEYSENSMKEMKVLYVTRNKKKSRLPKKSPQNEVFYSIQAILFIAVVGISSYYGIRYGCTEYSLLDNGKVVNGLVPLRKTVVTLSVGYSMPYAIVYSICACMLLYSIVMISPRWSLPLLVVLLPDIVCNIGDAFAAFWLIFTRFSFSTAITYTAGAASILSELWVWLGILRLYELKKYDS